MYVEKNAECVDEVLIMMKKTYASQINVIIADNRNIEELVSSWPFLQYGKFIIGHATTPLGNDVMKIWQDLLKENAKVIRTFFSSKSNTKNKEEI